MSGMFARFPVLRSAAAAFGRAAAAQTAPRAPAARPSAVVVASAGGTSSVRPYSSRRYPLPVNPHYLKQRAARMAKLRKPIGTVLHPTGIALPDLPSFEINLNALPCKRKLKRTPGRGRYNKGKRCGRGDKGRKARGKVPIYYEGGQSTFFEKMPIRPGFKLVPPIVDLCFLDRIQHWINTGRIDPSKPITMRELHSSNCCKVDTDGKGIRLEPRGAAEFHTAIQIEVAEAAPEAIEAIERAGGSIVCRYYNKKQLKALLRPSSLVAPLEIDEPAKWTRREYYTKKENRGRLYWDKNPDDPDRERLFPPALRFTHIQPARTAAYARAFKKDLASRKPCVPKNNVSGRKAKSSRRRAIGAPA